MTSRTDGNPLEAVMHFSHKAASIPGLFKPLVKPILHKALEPIPPARIYNVGAAQEIKRKVQIPVIVVGGIRSLAEMEDILDNRKADAVALSRPLILEPNLVNKMKEGRQTEARCISCNYCQIALEKEALSCHFGKLG
jgi:2,4-dienoyl-CoA reductase-like NADH-dependent reductase (Old Yellow Enzyme family)